VLEIEGDVYKSIKVKQLAPTMPVGSTELRPHRLKVGLYDITGDKLSRRKNVELDVTGALTEVTELAGEKTADLVLINDGDQSYAKLRFDDRSIATMKSHLGKLDDSLSRGLIWASLWDSTRDGELAASDYVTIAINALAGETDIATVTMTVAQIDTAIWSYAADANREKLREQAANAFEKFLDNAAAGSDHQLQYAKSFADFAYTPAQYEKIKAILNGSINGLTVDADLRWFVFICGVKRGIFNAADIETEAAKDMTAHGKQYAALAHAALPNAAAKATAFKAITTDNLSNTIHAYTCRGFNLAIHRELLVPFVDKYFESILEVWETKGYEIAETTATLLFPAWVISEETLKKAEHWLAVTGKDASHAMRRTVAEGRDSMTRSLKARAADK
jgi:aminopeptidase N